MMRKLAMILTGPALLTMAALSVPGKASAAPGDSQWNPIKGTVNSNGQYTAEERNVSDPRSKTDNSYGGVVLDLTNTVDGGLCVKLWDARRGGYFSDEVCWSDGEQSPKTLAKEVKAGTEFFVHAKKRGSGDNNSWGGRIKY